MIKKRKMQSSVKRVNERCVGESERKEVRAARETEQRGAEDRVTRTRWMENKGSSGKSEGSWGDVLLSEPHGKVVVIVHFQISFFYYTDFKFILQCSFKNCFKIQCLLPFHF